MMKTFVLLLILPLALGCNKQKLSNCKITKITMGYVGTNLEYSVVYSGKNIIALLRDDEKYTFTYDASDNMVKKERFDLIANKLLTREDLAYNSSGQILNYKYYSYADSANGELWENRDYSYSDSKLSEIRRFIKGNSQVFNWVVRINWKGGNPSTSSIYDTSGRQTGCLNPTKYIVENKENKFNELFPQFRYLDLIAGEDVSFIYLTKNILTQINYPCQAQPNDKIDFRYVFNEKGLITEIYRDQYLLRKFEYVRD